MNVWKSCLFLFLALPACGSAVAQAQSRPAPVVISDADKTYAASLATMTLDQVKEAVAKADPAKLTSGVAEALRQAGGKYLTARQPPPAIDLFDKGLVVIAHVNDPLTKANLLMNKGQAYRVAANNEPALECYDAGIEAYRQAGASADHMAIAYSARLLVRLDLGDPEGAEEDGNASLQLYRTLGDSVSIARVLNNLGNAERTAGDFSAARSHYEEGLRIAREQKQRLGESFLLTNIADTYLQEDNPDLAASYCLQAIKIKEELGRKDDLVTSLVDLASIYERAGKKVEALQTAERAYTLASESDRTPLVALALSAWGGVEYDQNHLASAQEKYDRSIAISRKNSDHLLEYQTQGHLAQVELDMQHYAEAAKDAQEVLDFSTDNGIQQNVADASDTLGLAQLNLGNQDGARRSLETSVAMIEIMRENVAGGDQARSKFFAKYSDTYQQLISLDIVQGRNAEAFRLSEQEKGRALLDLLTHGSSTLSSRLTVAEKSEERHLRANMAGLEAQRASAVAVAQPDHAHLMAVSQQLDASRRSIAGFRERMYAAHPDLSRRRGDAQLISIPQASGMLSTSATAILEYEVTAKNTYLFVLTRGADGPVLHAYTLPVAAVGLRTRIERFQAALTRRDPGFATASTDLYRLLLQPARQDLLGKRSLIIVPSADLWHLSFQALKNGSGRFLLEDASVSYAPSLSVLRAYTEQPPPAYGNHVLLAMGDPGSDLPGAAREVQTLATLYGKDHVLSFTGSAATKENFRANAVSYSVVHLATHGTYDDHSPMYSHLTLAGTKVSDNTAMLSQLDAAEIADMKINAGLVVLSACETGSGKYLDGEGLIGLGWSFLAAGSQSAVATQWRVESTSTTELMIAFHHGLQQRLSKAEALRRAQLQLSQDPRFQNPFYWAGFVLLGGN